MRERGRRAQGLLVFAAFVAIFGNMFGIWAFVQAGDGAVTRSSRFAAHQVSRMVRPTNRAEKPLPSLPEAHVNSELVHIAHRFIHVGSGFYSAPDPDMFAADFVFRGPYIGPLNKEDYLMTMGTFKIYEALPDISPNAFGYTLDPQDPNRVWFLVRNSGTFTGEPGLGLPYGLNSPPNGAKLKGCPETFSITFNEDRQVKGFTVGYVADRFEGNTKGKGAAVGIFNAIGFPFPEPGPLLIFVQWFGTVVLGSSVKSYSKKEAVPGWWTNDEMGAEGYS